MIILIIPFSKKTVDNILVEGQRFLSAFRHWHPLHTLRERNDLDSFQFRADARYLTLSSEDILVDCFIAVFCERSALQGRRCRSEL